MPVEASQCPGPAFSLFAPFPLSSDPPIAMVETPPMPHPATDSEVTGTRHEVVTWLSGRTFSSPRGCGIIPLAFRPAAGG